MAERNQVKIRLQTKAGISQWQGTRFFNTDSTVALQQFRIPFANVTKRLNPERHSESSGPAPLRPRARRCRAGSSLVTPARHRCHAASPTDAPCRCTTHLDLNNSTPPRNIHIHRQVLRHGILPSEPLCRNGTTTTPAWTKPSRSIPTLQVNYTHSYAPRSPSIDTMRFFLDLHADGLFHPHSLLCFPSHKQEQS